MLNILSSIADFITSAVDFLVNTFQSFINLLSAIPQFTSYIFSLIGNLIPDILKPFLIISIVVGIILLILGRN